MFTYTSDVFQIDATIAPIVEATLNTMLERKRTFVAVIQVLPSLEPSVWSTVAVTPARKVAIVIMI